MLIVSIYDSAKIWRAILSFSQVRLRFGVHIQLQGSIISLAGILRIEEGERRLKLKLSIVLFNLDANVVHEVRLVDVDV